MRLAFTRAGRYTQIPVSSCTVIKHRKEDTDKYTVVHVLSQMALLVACQTQRNLKNILLALDLTKHFNPQTGGRDSEVTPLCYSVCLFAVTQIQALRPRL